MTFNNNLYIKKVTYYSPNKDYKISVKGNGAKWPFGEEDIKIYAYRNNFIGIFNKKIYVTSIYDKGVTSNKNNFYIEWENNNVAYLSFYVKEKECKKFKITFGNEIVITHETLIK